MRAIERYKQDLRDRGYDDEIVKDMARRLQCLWVVRGRETGLTYSEIGKRIGVSLERARIIHQKAGQVLSRGRPTPIERYADQTLYPETKRIAQAARFFGVKPSPACVRRMAFRHWRHWT